MGAPIQFLNVESLVVAFLRARPELSGTAVEARLPAGYDGVSPVVVVSRVGGEFAQDDLIDHALVRIDTYGPDRTAALDLAGRVRGLLWSLPETSAAPAVIGLTEQRGPTRLRDPVFTSASRYTTRYEVLVPVTRESV